MGRKIIQQFFNYEALLGIHFYRDNSYEHGNKTRDVGRCAICCSGDLEQTSQGFPHCFSALLHTNWPSFLSFGSSVTVCKYADPN